MLRWPRPDEMILAACALNRQDQPASVRAEQLIEFQSEKRKAVLQLRIWSLVSAPP